MDTLPKQPRPVNLASRYRHVKGDADETIIRLDHDLKVAEVWTRDRRRLARLLRLGFRVIQRQGGGAWVRGHAGQICFKNPDSRQGFRATEASLGALARARASRQGPEAA